MVGRSGGSVDLLVLFTAWTGSHLEFVPLTLQHGSVRSQSVRTESDESPTEPSVPDKDGRGGEDRARGRRGRRHPVTCVQGDYRDVSLVFVLDSVFYVEVGLPTATTHWVSTP